MNIFPLRLALPQRICRANCREITLQPRQVWSAQLNVGERVRCGHGVIWLTQSGEARDFVLRAGQSFVAPRRGHVVAQALGATSAILNREANLTKSR